MIVAELLSQSPGNLIANKSLILCLAWTCTKSVLDAVIISLDSPDVGLQECWVSLQMQSLALILNGLTL